MRIFFPNAIIHYPPASGRDIHRYQLIKNLRELGHDVHTLLPDEHPETQKHRRNPWSVIRELRKADALYCRLDYGPNAATDLTLPRSRWLVPRGTVVVWEFNVSLRYSPHEERPAAEIERAIDRLRRAAGRVDAAICVTRQLADEARDMLGIQSVHVVQNGSDPEMFRRDLPRPAGLEFHADRLNVTFIASGPNPYHDTPLICEAARLVAERNLPIDFHIIGASERLFPDNGPPNLHHHGRISYLELPKYLAAMDVGLVLYQKYEDGLSPLKLFDYLASGCVPICSPSQPMNEVLEGTEAGLVERWDAGALCDALVRLHQNRSRLEQMRATGRQLILEKYSWRRIAERTVDIIQHTPRREQTSS